MKRVLGQRWLQAVALVLVCLVPLAAPAGAVERMTKVGKISGTPMGTWMTVTTGGTGPGSTMQVDLAHAKISDKGKSIKRYGLTDGMKVRVKGALRGSALAADTVEVLEHASKKQAKGK